MSWLGLIDGDYDRAVLRLATITRQRVDHLVFGWLELLPPEMPSPSATALASRCGNDRLYFTRSVMSLADGMAWYEGCWSADTMTSPASPVPVNLATNAAEPPTRRLVLRGDVPFSPAWHLMPRVHRLVPMAPLAEPVRSLVSGMAQRPRYIRARQWLIERLHFDVLAHDDWMGSLCLVAPNPVLGSGGASIVDRVPHGETLQVRGRIRQGISPDGVRVVFQERRADGSGFHAEASIDALGRAQAEMPDMVSELAHQVVCGRRGLLHDEAPGWFLRNFTFSSPQPIRKRVVHLRRGSSGEAEAVPLTTQVYRRESEAISGNTSPVMKLEALVRARENRFGSYRWLSSDVGSPDTLIFENDREEAILFLRRQVARARRSVMLVDPYLEQGDLELVVSAAEMEGVDVEAVTSPRSGHYLALIDGVARGTAMTAQIAAMRHPDMMFGRVDVRVALRRRLHDRFLRIDDDVLWHLGHSLNGFGRGELSVINRIAKPVELIHLFDAIYAEAQPYDLWWVDCQRAQPEDSKREASPAGGEAAGD